MEILIVSIFVMGYLLIALEHSVNINKTATALFTGVICWTIYSFSAPELVGGQLSHHLGKISEILFFLLGAMTIVELVDSYQGFRLITDKIKTTNPVVLIWIVAWVTFFLSSILDNLTTSIVMVSLIRKLIPEKSVRLTFASMIVIAANAGGAWTPIGDVTTTMLWIGGQVTTLPIMKSLFIPSIACLLAPLLVLSYLFTKQKDFSIQPVLVTNQKIRGSNLMLFLGVSALIFVPIFKSITHLPPYLGMLLGLSVLWVTSEFINPQMDEAERKKYSAAGALSRIDSSSVLFFLGILLAVGALESMDLLHQFSIFLDSSLGDNRLIITLIGMLSAVVDNVPLVAASMGMYDLETYPTDHMIWQYLAYCAGTGGSILIIGSAAGVAVMGMEKIDFLWYVKKISLLALLGYLTGCAVYLLF